MPKQTSLFAYSRNGDGIVRTWQRKRRYDARVKVESLRRAYELSGMTRSELARRLGWKRGAEGKPDSQRVRRCLGIVPASGDPHTHKTVRRSTAVAMVRAMDLDPVDFGL